MCLIKGVRSMRMVNVAMALIIIAGIIFLVLSWGFWTTAFMAIILLILHWWLRLPVGKKLYSFSIFLLICSFSFIFDVISELGDKTDIIRLRGIITIVIIVALGIGISGIILQKKRH